MKRVLLVSGIEIRAEFGLAESLAMQGYSVMLLRYTNLKSLVTKKIAYTDAGAVAIPFIQVPCKNIIHAMFFGNDFIPNFVGRFCPDVTFSVPHIPFHIAIRYQRGILHL